MKLFQTLCLTAHYRLYRNHSVGYLLNSTLNAKTTSFGYGERTPLVKGSRFEKQPEPGQYKMPSAFEKAMNKTPNQNQGKSFGAGRNAYDRVFSKEQRKQDKSLPGPGTYDQESFTVAKNKNLSFTMLPRLPKETSIVAKEQNPGPGTYREQDMLSSSGRYVLSETKNACVPQFKRSYAKLGGERIIGQTQPRDVPGPGSYTPQDIGESNRFKITYDLKLHKNDRNIQLFDKAKIALPGPDSYDLPSDFGNLTYLASNLASTKSAQNFNIPVQSTSSRRHIKKITLSKD